VADWDFNSSSRRCVPHFSRGPQGAFSRNTFLIPSPDGGFGAKGVLLPSILAAWRCKDGRFKLILVANKEKSCCPVWQETETGSHDQM